MSLNSTDKGLLTHDNCAVIFIDHQPQMFFGVANIDRQDLLNNVLLLAKAAKIFHVPVILTAVISVSTKPGSNGIDEDAARRQFESEVPAELVQHGLGHGVCARACFRTFPMNRSDVDDPRAVW